MSTPLRVLIVEAAGADAAPLLAALTAGGYDPAPTRASTAVEMSAALADGPCDVVLAEVVAPDFGAAGALALLKHSAIDVPLIVVSGAASEDLVVDMMRGGAGDYVLRTNLVRLAPAVARELADAAVRRARRDAEHAAKQLAAIVLSSSDPIISETLDGVITSWNASAELLYGWTAPECVGHNTSFLIPPDRVEELGSVMDRLKAGIRVHPFETVRLHKDGSRVDVAVTVSPIRDDAGALVGVSKSARDIGEKKRAENAALEFAMALARSEERYRVLVETIPHMVWMAGPDGSTDFLNQRGATLLGIPPEAVYGWNWRLVVHPDDQERSRLRWERAVAEGLSYSNEYRIQVADGTYRWYFAQAVPLRAPGGGVERWIGTCTDINDRRLAEDRLAHDATLLAQVRDSVVVTDVDGSVTYWNEGASRLFGWAAEEMLGRPLGDRFPEHERAGAAEIAKSILAGRVWSSEFEDYRKDGSRVWIDASVTRISDAAGTVIGVMGVSHDISGRKDAEHALRMSEQRFRQIAESISGVFWLTDSDKIVYVSPAYDEIWGRSRESLYANPRQWVDAIHEEDRNRVTDASRTRLAGDYDEVYRIVRPDGSIRWIRDRGFPVRTGDEEAGRVAGMAEDVTERLQLEGQLRQSQKMEAVGQLAGGVAHDFNNLLTIITGYSELLLEVLPVDDTSRELVSEIMRAGERSAALTRQLLALSRKQVLAPKVLDLSEIVRDTEKLLRRVIGEDVELRSVLPARLGSVRADAGQLEQVLLNLAVNARDAMPRGGTLLIQTSAIERGVSDALAHPDVPFGRYIALTLTDSGQGMTPDVQQHLFEPFFTTKEPGKGTGLGLAVVHGFIKQSGGHVEVHSTPGVGTTFRICLPIVDEVAEAAVARAASDLRQSAGTETILLVEDDEAVRALSKRVLQRCGYTVLESSRGDSALRNYGGAADTIHLLVTDVVLPGGGGRLLADQLRLTRPGMGVLYVSGYTDDAVVRQGVLQLEVDFLQKPFTPAALALKVRDVLDRARAASGTPAC